MQDWQIRKPTFFMMQSRTRKFNHEELIRILTTRSKLQLLATFNRYRDDHGTSLLEALSGEHGDDFKKVLQTAVRCIHDHKKYLEEVGIDT
ncbi:hypothetical protein Tsubulata_001393 [Turnera subulata]|uniref:Annexin n=1 Tax=Turnera subulata TaxID=218843 RepID=A0A9Q0FLI0_9ROSI|nr:hypothetical protein Tsubulata_001393 [Turnera subulata]